MQEERKLTLKEQQRKQIFENLCMQLQQQGYQSTDLTVSVVKANIVAIGIMLPFIIIMMILFFMINPKGSLLFSIEESMIILGILLILVVIHELIHGFVWGLYAKKHFQSIDFGIIWSMLTPYCTCSEPLNKKQYIMGSIMPTIILGFGIGLLGIIFNHTIIFILGELMILCGGGDFYIIYKILKYKNIDKQSIYFDHPYECGVVVFEKR